MKQSPGEAGVSLGEVDVPAPEPGFARLRVVATGVCGTDIHIARDEYGSEAPVIMGHEILGDVDAVGDDADAHWVSRRVATETYYSTCGRCDWCRDGAVNLCPSRRSIGSFENGGFAPYVVVPIGNLHALPSDQGPDAGIGAVLSEPLACVAQCLCDPPVVNPGDEVLVIGPGAMGQLSAQVARAQGGSVTLAGLPKDADRLRVARNLGFSTTTETPDAESFDVVLEASGSAPGAALALSAAKRAGRYVQVGIFGRDVTVPLDSVLYKELTVTSGFASTPTSWRRAMALMEQELVTLDPLVTESVPIAEWERAFENIRTGRGIKTVIVPHGD
ncbi:zinc-dependent alcohol dehydrogenase [Paramicrobacterium fandaimingii]|uniref:zinc-dependent alcohol dehydrogenase n=1 Tax=Paramicrobacterium fandaimingii TaxID=2708079 RepID=UPI001AB05696|nr:alcohol dehydrogenase catalytic domain-containing protein [Microbacterium fandaimingii]